MVKSKAKKPTQKASKPAKKPAARAPKPVKKAARAPKSKPAKKSPKPVHIEETNYFLFALVMLMALGLIIVAIICVVLKFELATSTNPVIH